MSQNLRVYRRELALYVLAGCNEALMASELTEHMVTQSQVAEHPEHCWRTLGTSDVSGVLTVLRNEGLVTQSGEKRDRRAGADRPTWVYALGAEAAKRVRMPEPPSAGAPATSLLRQPPPNPYDDLSRTQLYALLEIGDLAMQELARVQQEGFATLQRSLDVNGRMRRILAGAGLEDRLS